jgi:hypothetical protein
MPELHKNQIQWEAPEPRKVSLDAVDLTPVADGLKRLGRAADEFSRYKAYIDDINAREQMNQTSEEGLARLEKWNPDDNNYEPARKEFEQALQNKFNTFDEATKNRFMRENPEFFEEQKLKAKELTFQKEQKFTIETIGDTIPLLTSNVITGKKSYADQRKEMENMVAKVDNVTAQDLLYKFDKDIQLANIENHIQNGEYSRVVDLLNDPNLVDTDAQGRRTGITTNKISATERIKLLKATEDSYIAAQKEADALKKTMTKQIDDKIEEGLTNTLFYAIDNEKHGNSFVKAATLFDDPEAIIDLTDVDGKVYARVKMGDVNPETRRKVLKHAEEYAKDNMYYRVNALKANEQLENYMDLFYKDRKKRPTGEQFNNIYNLVNSENARYLTADNLKKAQRLLDDEVNMYTQSVKPTTDFANKRMLYGTGVEFSAPTPARIITENLFYPERREQLEREVVDLNSISKQIANWDKLNEEERAQIIIDRAIYAAQHEGIPLKPISINSTQTHANRLLTDERTMYNQATKVMRESWEKETDKTAAPGSAIQYVMNQTAQLLYADSDQRKLLGATGASDEQISLTFRRLSGILEQQGLDTKIIGQNQTTEEANKFRKELFDKFYTMLNNGNKPYLTDEQQAWQKIFYDTLARASYGTGGGMLSFEETLHGASGVPSQKIVYPQTFESNIEKRQEKWLKQ